MSPTMPAFRLRTQPLFANNTPGPCEPNELSAEELAYMEESYVAHELVGPLARPGEKPLAGTTVPTR